MTLDIYMQNSSFSNRAVGDSADDGEGSGHADLG